MKCILSIWVLLSLSSAVLGQQPAIDARRLPPAAARPDSTGRQLSRLLRTADDLERAGQSRQAAAVRQEADWERQSLLRRLDDLQAEVQQIREATGSDRQILVRIQILEVSLSKAQSAGFDMSKLTDPAKSPPSAVDPKSSCSTYHVINDAKQAEQLVEALRKDNLVRMLSDPALLTTSGRPAIFSSGGKFPVPRPEGPDSGSKEYQEYGTRVDLTADLLGDQKVRLAIHCRTAELDPEHTVTVGKAVLPGIRALEFQTTTELQDDQTLLLAGPVGTRAETTQIGIPVVGSLPWHVPGFKNVGAKNIETQVFVLVRPAILASPTVAAIAAGNNAVRQSDLPSVTSRPAAIGNVRR
jgi:Flp pilus assembly secretin CpaC